MGWWCWKCGLSHFCLVWILLALALVLVCVCCEQTFALWNASKKVCCNHVHHTIGTVGVWGVAEPLNLDSNFGGGGTR